MSEALGQLFGSGMGVALSPIPIIAVILMLGTPKARANGLAFLAGWVLGLAGAMALVVVLAGDSNDPSSTSADGAHVVTLLIGVLFLALAVKQWKARPRGNTEPELPKWMAGIDGFSAGKSFGLGLVLAGVNPKNLALAASAGLALAATGTGTAGSAAGVAVVVIIGSLSIGVPVIGMLAMPGRMTPVLASAKIWMVRNNATVMFVLFAVLGATKLGDGIAGL